MYLPPFWGLVFPLSTQRLTYWTTKKLPIAMVLTCSSDSWTSETSAFGLIGFGSAAEGHASVHEDLPYKGTLRQESYRGNRKTQLCSTDHVAHRCRCVRASFKMQSQRGGEARTSVPNPLKPHKPSHKPSQPQPVLRFNRKSTSASALPASSTRLSCVCCERRGCLHGFPRPYKIGAPTFHSKQDRQEFTGPQANKAASCGRSLCWGRQHLAGRSEGASHSKQL